MLSATVLEPLTVDECLQLLPTQTIGRLAHIRDGVPHVLPMNYVFHQGVIVVRTGYGETLDAVHRSRVAFECDAIEPERGTGWSVVVHGMAEEASKPQELEELRRLPLRPWAPGRREHYLLIRPHSITGRRIR